METPNGTGQLKPVSFPCYQGVINDALNIVEYCFGSMRTSVGPTWLLTQSEARPPQGWTLLWKRLYHASCAILWHRTGSVDVVRGLAVPFMVEMMAPQHGHFSFSVDQVEDWIRVKGTIVMLQNELSLLVPPCHPGGPHIR